MPGQSKCFQCGSVLDGTATVVDVHPPRMAPWKKPFRGMVRLARWWKLLPSGAPAKNRPSRIKLDSADYTCLWGLLLSIIPGFAHLVHRRFRELAVDRAVGRPAANLEVCWRCGAPNLAVSNMALRKLAEPAAGSRRESTTLGCWFVCPAPNRG